MMQVTQKVDVFTFKGISSIVCLSIILHLPVKNDFYLSNNLFCKLLYGQEVIYEELLIDLDTDFQLIHLYPRFKDWINQFPNDDLFLDRHYSPKANNLIANEVFSYINSNYKNIVVN